MDKKFNVELTVEEVDALGYSLAGILTLGIADEKRTSNMNSLLTRFRELIFSNPEAVKYLDNLRPGSTCDCPDCQGYGKEKCN